MLQVEGSLLDEEWRELVREVRRCDSWRDIVRDAEDGRPPEIWPEIARDATEFCRDATWPTRFSSVMTITCHLAEEQNRTDQNKGNNNGNSLRDSQFPAQSFLVVSTRQAGIIMSRSATTSKPATVSACALQFPTLNFCTAACS